MVRFRIGCSSWTSPAWSGRFYPERIREGDRLAYYANFFDCVEVDASYYAMPSRSLVEGWARKSPKGFLFALKAPRDLLDPRKGPNPGGLGEFVTRAQLLGPKLGPILLQFPPWFRPSPSTGSGTSEFLAKTLDSLPGGGRYALELRDPGWFRGSTSAWLETMLKERSIALCWSALNYLEVPALRTAPWAYVRFIGDHTTIPSELHGELRADRSSVTRRWAERVTMADLLEADVFFNNHFAGYAPDSANLFRSLVGLPRIEMPARPADPERRSGDRTGPF